MLSLREWREGSLSVEAVSKLIEDRMQAAVDGDYYGVLGVEKEADGSAIQASYIEIAKCIHPDMLGKEGLEDYKEKASALFKFATEAQEILTHAKKRESYDSGELVAKGIHGGEGTGSEERNRKNKAKLQYQKGSVLLNRKGWVEAEVHLRQAVELSEDEPRYWRKLGWAVFNNSEADKSKRQDEACRCWIQALELNEEDPEAHYYMALYHKSKGDMKKMRKALSRTVKLKPRHVEAQRELRLLKMREEKVKAADTPINRFFQAFANLGKKKSKTETETKTKTKKKK
jgi:curved DNA-binding protein CbpA